MIPFSPCIFFIMVLEALNIMIRKAENGPIYGFVVGNNDVSITHLQYVVDMIIVYKGDIIHLGFFEIHP